MVVLGRGAVSYEPGTPVIPNPASLSEAGDEDTHSRLSPRPNPSPLTLNPQPITLTTHHSSPTHNPGNP